jgi:virginiamycin B lyase
MNPDGTGIVEYPLPHPDSAPRILARGADGNLWFSEHLGNRVGRITQDGVISEWDIPTPASQPRAIALGADHDIWFGMYAAGKLGRITPAGVITEYSLPTPDSGPRALAAGADGNIWFSEYRTNKIGRITPDGQVTEFALPRPNSGPGDITMGPDGALWFVELSGGIDGLHTDGNRVGRIAYSGKISEYPLPAGAASPINIAVGPDRNLWYTRGAALGRVTVAGVVTEFPAGEAARGSGLSAGSDREPPLRLVNRLWFADGGANHIGYLQFTPAASAQSPGAAADAAAATTFIVRFTIKPGRNADFEQVMSHLQGQLGSGEPGNVYYDLYRPAPDSQTYVLIEHYRDAGAVGAHGRDPATQAMAAAIKDLLASPPVAERLILVSSKP